MHKPPSWNQIRTDAATFAARWSDETDENAGAQSFWNEFLAIFGIDRKRVAVFEKRAERLSTGGRGRIDLFWPGVMLAEHKSAGKDLDKAEDQAIDYLESIDQDDFPGLLVVSDFARMRVTDLGGDRIAYEFPTKDLVKEIDRFAYLAGYSHRQLSKAREHEVDIQAARLMGSLYEKIAETGLTEHEVSVFLVRMLFVMFADDTGLWEKSLFQEFVETRTQPDGSDLGSQIAILFQTLDRPEDKRPATLDELLARFPYVNGGLFSDRLDIPSFDSEIREILLECCGVDWGSIVPAIFGSLFQAVKSREDRRHLGEHYTTEPNILKVIGPLFLDDLRAEYESAFHDVKRLSKLRTRLGDLRFLDPACGCGNFLVIAYREMRQLELDILIRLSELTGEVQLSLDPTMGLCVSPAQFHGIELEEWPARIAEAAMFLVDHQANQILARRFGEAPHRLPISTAADIHVGNALRMDWAEIVKPGRDTFLLGNPPYSGGLRLDDAQRDDRELVFNSLDVPVQGYGRLDYVACFLVKGMAYVAGTGAKCAFVMTNSVVQGEQSRSLAPILGKYGLEIDFAHRTFAWSSEAPGAAAVHVVIMGIADKGTSRTKRLFEYADLKSKAKEREVSHINYWLIDYEDVAIGKVTSPLIPGLPGMTVGSQPTDGGNLTIQRSELEEVLADPIAAKYVRPFPGAEEMLQGGERWCLWLPEVTPQDIRASKVLSSRLEKVREARTKSPTPAFRKAAETPFLFTHRKHPDTAFLAIPTTSSSNRDYIPARYYDENTIASNKLTLIPDCPLWIFGVLESSMWMSWTETFAGRLKSDYNVTADLQYNAFPWPAMTESEKARLEELAQRVLDAREAHPGATLADLYDRIAMPPDLRAAHRAMDECIEALYGLKGSSTDAERLRALLKRYEELSTADQLPMKAAKSRSKK